MGPSRSVLYVATGIGIAMWAAGVLWLAVALHPVDHYLVSYYLADYRFGFIRRGLAGELVGPSDAAGFFGRAGAVRWTITAMYLSALAALAGAIVRTGRSERRIMLALLVPVLPFGVPFAVFSARPDLLGAAAVVALALGVATRPALSCAVYGLFIAVLAFTHDAIPLEFALGAVLAIYVLAHGLTAAQRRRYAALAVLPGLAVAGLVTALTRHGVADRLCATTPHRLMRMMASFPDFQNFARTGRLPTRDFHDWACRSYLNMYQRGVLDDIHTVAARGAGQMVISLTVGLVGLAACLAAVHFVAGVPIRDFLGELRDRRAGAVCALALYLPIFATAFDWIRWLLLIALNVTVVSLLYLRGRPELDGPPPSRAAFVAMVCAFAALPLGLVPG
ncbi:hypothetical protein OS122_25575 [Mycolicibacterium mucogenicum]|uniref:hypothetical protein n=1 Tax=Mycolicibacterium mucogenicum TaxID=56689 RepID=UPI002269BE65|nr:hypothetical protein [Mycolicibacterium mucogenicum]MCX8564266.1 hypothetical protein [Mycolicibacterium mucogenicum]